MNPELERFLAYPRFPDGRINYRDAPERAVVNAVIWCEGRVLILKRSNNVGTYPEKWMCVAGYVDRVGESVEQAGAREAREETGLEDFSKIAACKPYTTTDQDIVWHVYPVRLSLKEKKALKLNKEHTEYRWVSPEALDEYEIVPQLRMSVQQCNTHI